MRILASMRSVQVDRHAAIGAAAADNGRWLSRRREASPRRIVVSFSGDMKGLLQISGLAGPSGTYFCLVCLAYKNKTSVAGIPCLRHPPEGAWTAAHPDGATVH